MTRAAFLLFAAFALMGNTVFVLDGPRLLLPRDVPVGEAITVSADEEFLVSDVYEIDRVALSDDLAVAADDLAITFPAGTVFSSFLANDEEPTRWATKFYCSALLEEYFGDRRNFPAGISRKKDLPIRLCFKPDESTTRLTHVFVSNNKGPLNALRAIEPAAIEHLTDLAATPDRVFWEVSKVTGRSDPKFTAHIGSYRGDVLFGGTGIYWQGRERKGKSDWLTDFGNRQNALPAQATNVMGMFDLTVLSADAKAGTIELRVDRVHEPVMFLREFGAPPRIIYVYIP